ncbi:MAG TPA: hypothetical protein VK304_06010 [Thermoleophilaceae bacterium]|nr:hypothetical protein [Thermoleophilaceae bacterium]
MTLPLAHGLSPRTDLPIPLTLFVYGTAVVLVVSFVALAVLWREPILERYRWRPLPGPVGRLLGSRGVDVICGVIGVALLGLTVYSGLAGQQTAASNFAPTFVYVIFWVGLVAASILFGDVFRSFNPWRAVGRAVAWAALRGGGDGLPPSLEYPRRLGYWPAAVGLLAFTMLELASATPDDPSTVAIAALAYSVAVFIGMALYGVEPWMDRGEAFSVYFGLFAKLSPFETRERVVGVRPPLAGLTTVKSAAGLVALAAVMIGTVSFDGLSEQSLWVNVGGELGDLFDSLGMASETAFEAANAIGVLLLVGIVAGLYMLGVAGMKILDEEHSLRHLARSFAASLVPIALAYIAAHYLTLLAFQGQAMVYLASDPLGEGANLFGTAEVGINYFMGATLIALLQVGLVVTGHAAALAVAHDRALVMYDDDRGKAVPTQLWMLAVMVVFTICALLLLLAGNA